MLNGSTSSIKSVSTSAPQGSVLGQLLFLIYSNDLNKCVKYSSVYHFADDTNMLQSDSSLNNLSKQMNVDPKNLSQWLKGNKLSPKVYLRCKLITFQIVLSQVQVKNLFILQKSCVPFSKYSSFCIFNYFMIY